ncbi:hypothetical protein TVNIR_0134 [Thioalkalivibrio nitratireducens DSM 14787]|uniref:Uncharacterized protein n=1 Tax=Thioalkalivibrio nitratireducens (strain DSM 14787 / UNIQEM 213 / ALEN2) TaxID=1255043 RepID=L0DS82_THIND|nr:hypothetical protein [Thioalkalivibrio nitratireducens]AGA31847.1 hypothetical protein TVNIR_0134 [Thioalkalivibrio nitratireducens DSM 14787]
MNEPQAVSPRRRLQELLAIPDSKRTEAEWDELNELEISLAAVNQISAGGDRHPRTNGGSSGGEGRSGRGSKGRKPQMRSQKRPPRAAES